MAAVQGLAREPLSVRLGSVVSLAGLMGLAAVLLLVRPWSFLARRSHPDKDIGLRH